jgi:hypothetical protein
LIHDYRHIKSTCTCTPQTDRGSDSSRAQQICISPKHFSDSAMVQSRLSSGRVYGQRRPASPEAWQGHSGNATMQVLINSIQIGGIDESGAQRIAYVLQHFHLVVSAPLCIQRTSMTSSTRSLDEQPRLSTIMIQCQRERQSKDKKAPLICRRCIASTLRPP